MSHSKWLDLTLRRGVVLGTYRVLEHQPWVLLFKPHSELGGIPDLLLFSVVIGRACQVLKIKTLETLLLAETSLPLGSATLFQRVT